ncbi:MAG: GNAT family N-acetyltransferase [Eubacterium sp.]
MNVCNISCNSNALKDLKKLYLMSFPEEERLDFNNLVERQNSGKGHFLGFYDDQVLVGMIYYTNYKEIVHIFYFAVDKKYRSKGYGSMMLNHMYKTFNKHKIILLIEILDEKAKNNDQRIKRKHFYLSNGFTGNEQFLTILDVPFELLHRKAYSASISNFKEIMLYYCSDLKGETASELEQLKANCS